MPAYASGLPRVPRSVRNYLSAAVEEGKRNNELYGAACQMRDAGFTQDEAVPLLEGKAVADGLSQEEARATITSAFKSPPREAPLNPREASRTQAATVDKPAPVKLPEPITDGLPALLKAAFEPDEYVAIGPGSFSGGRVQCPPGTTHKVSRLLARLTNEPIDQIYPYTVYPDGVFIRINPMTQNGMADKDVTSYRHLLIEFDKGPKEQQYAALLDSGLPIAAIIDSGNLSVHGWIRLDAPDLKEYKRRAELVYRFMAKSGVDTQNKNPSRYSRCPGITRNIRIR